MKTLRNILILLLICFCTACISKRSSKLSGSSNKPSTTKGEDTLDQISTLRYTIKDDVVIIDSIGSLHGFLGERIAGLLPYKKVVPQIDYNYDDENSSKIYSIDLGNETVMRITLGRDQKSAKLNNEVLITDFKHQPSKDIDSYIDYYESQYYELSPTLFLIVGQPTNWTGLMSSFSLYQLVDVGEKVLYEFISFGDSPNVINKLEDESLAFLSISGDYDPTNDIWELEIKNRSLHGEYQPHIGICESENKTIQGVLILIKAY